MEGNKVAPGRIIGAVERTGPKSVFLEKLRRRILQKTKHTTNVQGRRITEVLAHNLTSCRPADWVGQFLGAGFVRG